MQQEDDVLPRATNRTFNGFFPDFVEITSCVYSKTIILFNLGEQWLQEYLPRFQRIIVEYKFSRFVWLHYINYVVSQMYLNFIGQNWILVNTGICFQAK